MTNPATKKKIEDAILQIENDTIKFYEKYSSVHTSESNEHHTNMGLDRDDIHRDVDNGDNQDQHTNRIWIIT